MNIYKDILTGSITDNYFKNKYEIGALICECAWHLSRPDRKSDYDQQTIKVLFMDEILKLIQDDSQKGGDH